MCHGGCSLAGVTTIEGVAGVRDEALSIVSPPAVPPVAPAAARGVDSSYGTVNPIIIGLSEGDNSDVLARGGCCNDCDEDELYSLNLSFSRAFAIDFKSLKSRNVPFSLW
jgi:hypothetical protein